MNQQPEEGKASVNDVLTGNRVIAEFMGGLTDDSKEWVKTDKRLVGEYKYHSSFDWIMPVVENISKMPLLNADNTECTDPYDTCFPVISQ